MINDVVTSENHLSPDLAFYFCLAARHRGDVIIQENELKYLT